MAEFEEQLAKRVFDSMAEDSDEQMEENEDAVQFGERFLNCSSPLTTCSTLLDLQDGTSSMYFSLWGKVRIMGYPNSDRGV